MYQRAEKLFCSGCFKLWIKVNAIWIYSTQSMGQTILWDKSWSRMGQGVMLFPRPSHFSSKGINQNFTWFITYIKIALPCIFASIQNKTKSNC